MNSSSSRREVASRKVTFFHKLASLLVSLGLKPNHVSVLSSVFAILGGMAFYHAAKGEASTRIVLLLAAIVCIQLRLICNLIDGLMAVECGLKTASGELFNDVPDRVSDVALILGAGFYAAMDWPLMIHVAWLACLGAVMTSYARCLGAAMTGAHDFCGPMAKQHRMFLLTLGAAGGVAEVLQGLPAYSMSASLMFIAIGSLWTTARRLMRIYRAVENKNA